MIVAADVNDALTKDYADKMKDKQHQNVWETDFTSYFLLALSV